MRRRRIIIFITFLLIIGIALPSKEVLAQRNTIYIFLLDTSLSMQERRALPFNRVREFLLEKVRDSKEGDRVVIITFDENVTNVTEEEGIEIITSEDKGRLENEIRTLRPRGQWTWMSRGLDVLSQKIIDLREAYREKKIEAYFLTDGINDPPPESEEPRLQFVELLLRTFRDFRTEDTYIYVLYSASDAMTSEQEEEIEDATEIVIVEIPQDEEESIIKQVRISPEELNLGYVKRGVTEIRGNLEVESYTAEGEIPFGLRQVSSELVEGMIPIPEETIVDPSRFSITRTVQRIEFSLKWENPLSALGEYYGELTFDVPEDVEVIPKKVKVLFTLLRDTSRKVWLGGTEFTLKKVAISELLRGEVERRFSLRIIRSQNLEGTKLRLQPLNPDIEIKPSLIPSEKGEYDMSVSFPADLEPGLGRFEIKVSHDESDVEIYPVDKKITLKVKVEGVSSDEGEGDGAPSILKILFFIILLTFLCLLGYLGLIRQKDVWVRRNDTGKVFTKEVSGWRRTDLSDLGLPNYYLQFDRFKNTIYLGKDNELIQQISHDKEITCRLPDGGMVNITVRFEPLQ